MQICKLHKLIIKWKERILLDIIKFAFQVADSLQFLKYETEVSEFNSLRYDDLLVTLVSTLHFCC